MKDSPQKEESITESYFVDVWHNPEKELIEMVTECNWISKLIYEDPTHYYPNLAMTKFADFWKQDDLSDLKELSFDSYCLFVRTWLHAPLMSKVASMTLHEKKYVSLQLLCALD